ncbi:collagen alpha-1(I) chain-like [Ahaetulla prasina]|uniref:collagen alpha-1(I) chain-like n=1 Tax=Ahaetulla prasina TaxID=499056 RepID=UPI002647B616|nr:collagen alpha-1(I) chain-like [Ahaetulla prasina]
MEFTTRFGLHSQATRLREDPVPARRGPPPASHRPRAVPRSEGLGPPAGAPPGGGASGGSRGPPPARSDRPAAPSEGGAAPRRDHPGRRPLHREGPRGNVRTRAAAGRRARTHHAAHGHATVTPQTAARSGRARLTDRPAAHLACDAGADSETGPRAALGRRPPPAEGGAAPRANALGAPDGSDARGRNGRPSRPPPPGGSGQAGGTGRTPSGSGLGDGGPRPANPSRAGGGLAARRDSTPIPRREGGARNPGGGGVALAAIEPSTGRSARPGTPPLGGPHRRWGGNAESRGGAPRPPASPGEAARGFEPPPTPGGERRLGYPAHVFGEGNWRRGKRPTLRRGDRDAAGPGLGRAARRPRTEGDARSWKTAAAAARPSCPSGLRKFPSDRSDAPEGERSGSRAGPPGPALGHEGGRKEGRADEARQGRRARPPGGGRGGGEDPGAGGAGARDEETPSSPARAARVTAQPTTAGEALVAAPEDARHRPLGPRSGDRHGGPARPDGPARAPPSLPGEREGGERAPAPPRTSGARRHPVPHAPQVGRRARGPAPRAASPARNPPGGGESDGTARRGPRPPLGVSRSLVAPSRARTAVARPSPLDNVARPFLPSRLAPGGREADAACRARRAPTGRTDPTPPRPLPGPATTRSTAVRRSERAEGARAPPGLAFFPPALPLWDERGAAGGREPARPPPRVADGRPRALAREAVPRRGKAASASGPRARASPRPGPDQPGSRLLRGDRSRRRSGPATAGAERRRGPAGGPPASRRGRSGDRGLAAVGPERKASEASPLALGRSLWGRSARVTLEKSRHLGGAGERRGRSRGREAGRPATREGPRRRTASPRAPTARGRRHAAPEREEAGSDPPGGGSGPAKRRRVGRRGGRRPPA